MRCDSRLALLWSLISLSRGNILVRGGDSFSTFLDGVPDVVHVVDSLIDRGWVTSIDETNSRFVITRSGLVALNEGLSWWRSHSWWRRLLALPEPYYA